MITIEEIIEEISPEVAIEEQETLVGSHNVVLYNDDVNTFDYVTDSLVEVCGHDLIQAEQCTYLVHYRGKCSVKNGHYEGLEPVCSELLRRGLTARIENR